MKQVRWFAIASAAALLAGCIDPTTPGESAVGGPQRRSAQPWADFVTVPRFDIGVEVLGELRPNAPITLQADIRGIIPTTNAQIRLSMPELEAAKRSGQGDGFQVPVKQRLAPLDEVTTPVAAGGVYRRTTNVIVPSPGYYRLVISARAQLNPQEAREHRNVDNVAYKVVWLWIAEDGSGRITS